MKLAFRRLIGPVRRIVVISEVFPPEQTATAVFTGGIALALARRWAVVVVAGPMRYPGSLAGLATALADAGVRVYRPKRETSRAYRLWHRLGQVLQSTVSLAVGALRLVRRGDVVLATTNPPLAPLIAALVARVKGARCIIRVDDLYPDALIAVGLIAEKGLTARVLRLILDWPLKTADVVVVLGRDVAERVSRRVEGRQDIRVIRNWWTASIDDSTAGKARQLRKSLGIRDELVVGYLGTFGRTHDFVSILAAARQLLDAGANIRFVLTGQGARFGEVAEHVTREELRNVLVTPACSDAELPAYLQLADVALISFPRGMAGVSVPSRMYNHLVAARPILGICEEESELARTIKEAEVGWTVQPGATASLVATLLRLEGNREEVSRAGVRARALAIDVCGYDQAASAYGAMFEQLVTPTE